MALNARAQGADLARAVFGDAGAEVARLDAAGRLDQVAHGRGSATDGSADVGEDEEDQQADQEDDRRVGRRPECLADEPGQEREDRRRRRSPSRRRSSRCAA